MRFSTTPPVITALLAFVVSLFQSRQALHLRILALQRQVSVYKRTVPRPRLRPSDRLFWSWLSRRLPGWQSALHFGQPRPVIAWQHKRFREHWRRLSQCGRPGRPAVAKELRDLIRDMSLANPLWGAPRIHGELLKLGLEIGQTTVAKYMAKRSPPTFISNHAEGIAALDLFVVPTPSFPLCPLLTQSGRCAGRLNTRPAFRPPSSPWVGVRLI